MWISRWAQEELKTQAIQAHETAVREGLVLGQNTQLKIDNARQLADIDWFKLRLNQVERERGQLIQAAIGIKVSVPEFVEATGHPADTLNEMPDFTTVGEDAVDPDGEAIAEAAGLGSAEDTSRMPGIERV